MRTVQAFNEKQLNDAYTVRHHVFVIGQGVPSDLERDALDKEALHFVGYLDDQPVAAGRMRIVDTYGKFERICVLEDYRGKSLGKKLMLDMEQALIENGIYIAKLNAQTHAESFYQALGYQTISEVFLDADMPHVTMEKRLTTTRE